MNIRRWLLILAVVALCATAPAQGQSASSVCNFAVQAASGGSVNKTQTCTIPNIDTLDSTYRQIDFACCGGGASSPTPNADPPVGIELQVTGTRYWSVSNPKLSGNAFTVDTYCGSVKSGPACETKVAVIAHYSAAAPAKAARTGGLSDFDQKLIVALVAGFLGFLATFLVDLIKRRREPNKELSYDLKVTDPLIDVSPQVAEKVKVRYGTETIKNLYFVVFNVENTGNRVVKNQHLRFSFDKESQLLEDIFEPEPPREYVVSRVEDTDSTPEGRRYLIGHFEHASKVSIRFVLSAAERPKVEVFPKNDEGDVAFEPRSQKKAADERHQISRFVLLVIVWWALPSINAFVRMDEQLSNIFHDLVQVIFFILILPLLRPVSLSITRAILERKPTEGDKRRTVNVDKFFNSAIIMDSEGATVNNTPQAIPGLTVREELKSEPKPEETSG